MNHNTTLYVTRSINFANISAVCMAVNCTLHEICKYLIALVSDVNQLCISVRMVRLDYTSTSIKTFTPSNVIAF